MINFFVDEAGSFGIRDYLANRGAELAGRVGLVLYEELADLESLPATGTIFAGLDQAGPHTLRAAAALHDRLSAVQPPVQVLNHPLRSLQRFTLLRRLHEIGCNHFTAIRATEDFAVLRYPVFIRYEHRHNGSMTPLLHDRRALDTALVQLRLSGVAASKLLIVEFCDTSSADGLYRKYSAMRIGDAIIPRHLHASRSWIAKSSSSKEALDEPLVREELDYLNDHPHERWLRAVFNEAGIDYGRIDYGLCNGEPQVWEINTNPTLGRGRHPSSADGRIADIRAPGRLATHRQMVNAFKALEATGPSQPIDVALPADIGVGVRAEADLRRRTLATHLARRGTRNNHLTRTVKDVVRPLLLRIGVAAARLTRYRGAP